MEKIIYLINTQNLNININGRICHHRIRVLYGLVEFFNLKNYLEIGVHNGSSMSYVLQSKKIIKCIGIDPFEDLVTKDPNMKHYLNSDKINIKNTLENINKNNKFNADIKILKKLSADIIDEDIDMEIDLLFIDGDHSYQSVLNDFNKFIKFVKSGGFIVFDDLHQEGPNKVFTELLNTNKYIKLFGIYEKTEGILQKL